MVAMHLATILLVFGVIFIAELPDKSLFAALILGTKFPKFAVWLGASAAFLIHVVVAVTAGKLLRLLPNHLVHAIVALLFLAGALLIIFGKHGLEDSHKTPEAATTTRHSFWKVFVTAFSLVFIGEWGDITQIATANYAATLHDPWSVGVGAGLALCSVTAIAVGLGTKVLSLIPAKLMQRLTAAVLLLFAVISAIEAFR
jgi:putative Ca2+/H+ antiporter (TMEM165/GDT1 family)